MLKNWLRIVLYRIGVLGAIHRVRNRRTLTVLMFHRVLPINSKEFGRAEREFTFSVNGFADCLDFLKNHYNVITVADLKAAADHGTKMPDRAALITFDDGWRDTLIYALPELHKRNMQGLLFLATEAINNSGSRWWQDLLIEIFRSPHKTQKLLIKLGLQTLDLTEKNSAWHVAAALCKFSEKERKEILNQFIVEPAEQSRQMLSTDDLVKLKGHMSLAGHGHTHVPLTESHALVKELESSYRFLIENQLDADLMSFPHGAYNTVVTREARDVGFKYLFSSNPNLINTNDIQPEKRLFGRVHIPENKWTSDQNGISFPKLASFLFFRPHG